ncbi:thioesterase II family protein [Thermoactinospora rubra]|uniref:thioesterase II family protein n=1 Tax=Thermoactinospora rubra TaxID=1088767 RepID=UPI000A109636|nr:thioesterase domain-containing protein [Thermoactinospora rubra]
MIVLPEDPPADPDLRLLVVPHAGGGAAVANPFRDAAPHTWCVGAVLFGGRESRFVDDPPAGMEEMIGDVVAAARAMPEDVPLVLVGQCSGAFVAFEAARRLDRPLALVALSSPAPDTAVATPDVSLPDERFTAEVLRMGGVPAEVADLPDLVELLLPAIRADFAAVAGYRAEKDPPLDRRMLVISSRDDPGCPPESVSGWAHYAASVDFAEVSGGHFLLGERPREVVRILEEWLR